MNKPYYLVAAAVCCLAAGCAEPTVSTPPTATAGGSGADSGSDMAGGAVTFLDSDTLQEGVGEADADAPQDFQTTDSGLKYRILRKTDGAKPTAADSVTVHYRGWLDNGNEFDSSYKRGESTSFPLGGVIKGWTEGLQLVGVGGMIELWIPSELGYGARGSGGSVPPNATLHFVVELLEIQ